VKLEIAAASLTMRMVRVGDDFQLPENLLTPEDALAWWEQRRAESAAASDDSTDDP